MQVLGPLRESKAARPLPVTVPVTAVTPSRAQREPAPLDRIATCRAASTGTVIEADRPAEKGALRRPDLARVLAGRNPGVALPAKGDEAKASLCALERVAHSGRVPAAAALRGGDAIRVESVRDRGEAGAGCSLAPDPLDRVPGTSSAAGRAGRPARACARAPAVFAARSAPARRGRSYRAPAPPPPRPATSGRARSRGRRARSPASARSP